MSARLSIRIFRLCVAEGCPLVVDRVLFFRTALTYLYFAHVRDPRTHISATSTTHPRPIHHDRRKLALGNEVFLFIDIVCNDVCAFSYLTQILGPNFLDPHINDPKQKEE